MGIDGGVLEAALISAAISTVGGVLAGTIAKPKAAQSPVSYPPNEITRGGYLPLVLGRRVIGCNIGWTGARDAINIHSGGGSSIGGGGGSSQAWMEGGWHQLCHGPVRRIYRIWQGDQVLYNKTLDATEVADGSTFSCNVAPAGDIFAVYFGRDNRDDPAYQPNDPFLLEKAGLDSCYPGLCHIVWRRKFLGSSPTWPLMRYEVDTRP